MMSHKTYTPRFDINDVRPEDKQKVRSWVRALPAESDGKTKMKKKKLEIAHLNILVCLNVEALGV